MNKFATLTGTTVGGQPLNLLAQQAVESARMLAFEFPLRVISEANQREHYMARHRRKVARQLETSAEWRRAIGARRIVLPCVIRLTRIGCKKLDDDNLANGFKACRDQIAREIGIDDGSELLRFEYQQEVTAKRQYAVRVEVMSK